ncbi:MAG: glycosyltransferase family 4 protein [Pseudomonadota bacterium]
MLNRTFAPAAGGAERYSIALVEHLAARHEIHVFAQLIDHQWPGVTYHRVSMPFRRPRWINQIWFAIATWWVTRAGFDVVHSHENSWHGDVQTVHVLPVKHTLFSGLTGGALAARMLKVWTSPRLLAYLWLERFRYAVRKGRFVVVISETLRMFFAATYPAAQGMTCVITPGITLPQSPVTSTLRLHARHQLGLPPDKACLLFVGNDFRKKGLQTAIEAMVQMESNTVLAIVGHSGQLPYFRQQAATLGLKDRVFFLGAMADVTPAYQSADCLAHPTLEDTFAMVVLEAMSHGLPVIVSSVAYCGISGWLSDGVDALILDDPRDASVLACAVDKILADGVLRVSLAEAARTFAAGFEWGAIAAAHEKIYKEVAAAHSTNY